MSEPFSVFVLVDLQKGFFEGSTILQSQKCINPGLIYPMVAAMCSVARSNPRNRIVWVRSDYTATAKKDPDSTGTDEGEETESPTRPRGDDVTHHGMWSAEAAAWEPCFEQLMLARSNPEQECVVEKTCYSAFQRTRLPELCAGASNVYVAGVMSHVCVKHTSLHGCRLGLPITLLADTCASYKASDHVKTIDELMKVGCQIASVLSLAPPRLRIPLPYLGAGDCAITLNCLEDHASVARKVFKEVQWGSFTMQGNEVPRRVCTQGTLVRMCGKMEPPADAPPELVHLWDEDGIYEPLYRHPVDDVLPTMGWSDNCRELRNIVEAVTGVPVNHALIQHYRYNPVNLTSEDHIGEHSDKVVDMRHGSSVCNVNLGGTRTMEFQPKRRDIPSHVPYPHNRVPMPPGSVFELGSATNRFFKHLIKKCMDVCVSKAYLWSSVDGRSIKTHDEAAVLLREVGRISLTLRDIATWKRRTDGYVVGQGAPSEGPYTRSIEEQRKNMLESFGKDNNETDFNWAENYGKGFDILSIKPCNVLYFINGSISSIRVRTMVRMLGMECREYRLRIMMKRSQTHTRFFSSLNPRKECPFFITTSGVRMNESLAILTYLDRWGCEKAPVDGFIATSNLPSPHFRGLAYAWMQEAENLNAAYEEAEEAIFKRKPGETNPPEHYAKLLRHVAHELEVWIPRIAKPLGGGPFLLGRAMCIADVAFFSVVNYMWRRGLDLTQYDPCLSAYYETVLSHPCCRAGVPPSWDTRRGKVNVFGRLASMAKGAAPEALEKSDEEGDE